MVGGDDESLSPRSSAGGANSKAVSMSRIWISGGGSSRPRPHDEVAFFMVRNSLRVRGQRGPYTHAVAGSRGETGVLYEARHVSSPSSLCAHRGCRDDTKRTLGRQARERPVDADTAGVDEARGRRCFERSPERLHRLHVGFPKYASDLGDLGRAASRGGIGYQPWGYQPWGIHLGISLPR